MPYLDEPRKAPPTVTTLSATEISANIATLKGRLDSLGDYTSVAVSFVWGAESQSDASNYPGETALETMQSTGEFAAVLTDLLSNTTYYYRVRASEQSNIYGRELSFRTGVDPGQETLVSISPTSQEVQPGGIFTVEVTVTPATAIAGVQFDLTFDPALVTVSSVVEGDLLSQDGADTYFAPGTASNTAGTIIGTAGAITTQEATVSSPGVFAIIELTAVVGGQGDMSPLHLINVVVGDAEGRAVSVSVNDGSVTVSTGLDWDVNLDDHTNVLDMIRIGQHWGETGDPHWIREDVNRDGVVNVLDMILIGQNWTG